MATPKKTAEQQLAELQDKMAKLKAKEKSIKSRVNAKERKERTKRLIAIGAEVEHYAGCQIENLENLKKYLRQYAQAIAKTQGKNAPDWDKIETEKETKQQEEVQKNNTQEIIE